MVLSGGDAGMLGGCFVRRRVNAKWRERKEMRERGGLAGARGERRRCELMRRQCRLGIGGRGTECLLEFFRAGGSPGVCADCEMVEHELGRARIAMECRKRRDGGSADSSF